MVSSLFIGFVEFRMGVAFVKIHFSCLSMSSLTRNCFAFASFAFANFSKQFLKFSYRFQCSMLPDFFTLR